MTTTEHTIINGDSRKMSEVQDGSVHLIVTSPPYWQLKDYGSEDQIGFNDSYEQYINNLNLVWKECFRILHEGCRLCINIGDQFARSVYYGRYKVIPIHSEIIRFCETIGFDFMGQIIWQKTTTTNTTGGAAIMGSYPYPRNGIVKLDFEYILLFKKAGNAPKPTGEQKEMAVLSNEEWNTYFSGHWHFNGARQDKHLAMFPEELPKRLLRMFSFPQETVLDPFLGSGTTAMVAKALGRNSIGYEINADFIPLIKDRVGSNNLLEKVKLQFLKQDLTIDLDKEYATLPYWFTDCHKTDKKIDVKKLQFGSKIDMESSMVKSECYMVKQVVSPEQIVLDNGMTVRLLGIKNNPETQKEAVDFLWSKLKGNKIFLKYDNVKYDTAHNLMVYMYLGNKTFINAHLLKNRLADLDNTLEFKYKEKFKKLTSWQKNGY